MSDPSLSWSTSIASSTSISSTTSIPPPPPPSPLPPLSKMKRRSTANKENHTTTSRPSLPLSPAVKHRDGRPSTAPLTPTASNTPHGFSSSPVKPFSLPSSPDRRLSRSSSASAPPSSDENIRVVVRIRALPSSTPTCVQLPSPSSVTIRRERDADLREYTASFDHVYDQSTCTETIFQETSAGLIHSLVGGYNAAILAYGQTSSGKTYTMMGDVSDGTQRLHGIIPRCMDLLFASIHTEVDLFNLSAREAAREAGDTTEPQSLSYAVAVSYFEIYNERVFDLLAPVTHRHPLDVRENTEQGVHIPDLTRRIIASPAQAVEYIHSGNDNRRVAATAHNVVSSRSHAVIQVTVERKVVGGGGGVVVSRLDLVDLAGSERYDARTHGLDSREGRSKAAEMSSINRSLNNLALVVTALTSQSKHVPYRNSTLTHLLKDSLGGNAKCQLIACINPSMDGAYESMNTLKYASRAKLIKNEVRQAAQRGEEEGTRGLHAEIERLRREKVAEKKKRRFFISSMTGVVNRMAQVCEEEDQAEVPIEEEDLIPEEDDNQEAEQLSGEEKVVPLMNLHISTRRSSSERLSVRFQDDLDASLAPLNSTLDGGLNCSLLNASSVLNQSTQSRNGRRYQFCDLFSTPHQRKQKRRYRFSVCETLHQTPAAPVESDPTPAVAPVLFSPATERLLQDFDEGMGKIYAVVKRKGRRDELRRESAMEVVREVEEMERVILEVKEEGDRREHERANLITRHQQHMQAKEAELNLAQDRLALLRREGQGREEEVAALRAEVSAKGEEMAALKTAHEQAMQVRDDSLQQRDAVISGLQRSLSGKEEERQQLLMRIAVLEDALREKEEETQLLQMRIDALQVEARRKEEDTVALMADFDRQRLSALQRLQQQADIILATEARIAEATADATSVRTQLGESLSASEALLSVNKDRARQVAELEAAVERYKALIESMAASAAAEAQRYQDGITVARSKGAELADELKEENELVLAAMMAESDQARAAWEQTRAQQAAVIAHSTQRIEALALQLRTEQEAAQQHQQEGGVWPGGAHRQAGGAHPRAVRPVRRHSPQRGGPAPTRGRQAAADGRGAPHPRGVRDQRGAVEGYDRGVRGEEGAGGRAGHAAGDGGDGAAAASDGPHRRGGGRQGAAGSGRVEGGCEGGGGQRPHRLSQGEKRSARLHFSDPSSRPSCRQSH